MICYRCNKIGGCPVFRTLHSMSNDFCINDCKDYDECSEYKYKRIAKNDALMRLIYDYFTGQVAGHTDDEAKKAITHAMWNLR